MDINAKMTKILIEAKKVLPEDAQYDKDGTMIPIEDFRKFIEKARELVNDAIPWYLKI